MHEGCITFARGLYYKTVLFRELHASLPHPLHTPALLRTRVYVEDSAPGSMS